MNHQNSFLGNENLPKLMARLSVPSICSQLVTIIYSITDRIYIGHIKDSTWLALTGIGICFPLVTLITAFALFSASGGAPLASIELGKSEHDKNAVSRAETILGNSLILLTIFEVLVLSVLIPFGDSILIVMGASSQTLEFASQYLKIYLCGTAFSFVTIGLSSFISCQGHSRTAMTSTLIGAVANIILDPLFIFSLGMGIRGAALATVLAQFLSAIWVLVFLQSKRSSIRLRASIIRFDKKTMSRICTLGLSSFVMASTESVIFFVFNSRLQKIGGDIYVGAMTILSSMMELAYAPVTGFTNGIQPIIGYNYGAEKTERVRKTIFSMTATAFAATSLFSLAIQIFRKPLVGLFTADPNMAQLAASILPVYFGAVWIFGIQMGAQRTFVALGHAKKSIFIALLRKIILLVPLALILSQYAGVMGIFIAEPVASTVSAVTSLVFLTKTYRRLSKT